MSDTFKKLVNEHRQKFETNEPARDLWSKIDRQMELKKSSWLSSKWLKSLKYLAFGASVLVIAIIYFTTKNQLPANITPANTLVLENRPVRSAKEVHIITSTSANKQNQSTTRDHENLALKNKSYPVKHTNSESVLADETAQMAHSTQTALKDSILNSNTNRLKSYQNKGSDEGESGAVNPEPWTEEAGKMKTNSANENRATGTNRVSKKIKLFIPEAPEKTNTYSATLYEGSSFRSVLRAYKFPGKFRLDDDGDISTVKTISCNRLEKTPNVKAVWVKGKTDKELILNIKRKFRNIVLLKKDGRKIRPEAISHYYRGLGVINEYKGRYFSLLFTDKVELILFFRDAQVGDKVVIDGTIESLIQAQP